MSIRVEGIQGKEKDNPEQKKSISIIKTTEEKRDTRDTRSESLRAEWAGRRATWRANQRVSLKVLDRALRSSAIW